jgi:hypothetical protein
MFNNVLALVAISRASIRFISSPIGWLGVIMHNVTGTLITVDEAFSRTHLVI